jgi:hypothetical protein
MHSEIKEKSDEVLQQGVGHLGRRGFWQVLRQLLDIFEIGLNGMCGHPPLQ